MLSINFDALRSRYPELTVPLHALEAWLREHPRIRHIEPARILYGNQGLDPWQLSIALGVLVDEGVLKQSFAVLGPSHTLCDEFYDSINDIPPTLRDVSHDAFLRDDGDIITIYREAVR
jgi:hypothetical protein